MLMGQQVKTTEMATAVIGGLVGVAVAKAVPAYLPAQLTSSPLMKVVTTGATAFAAYWVAKQVKLSERVASAVLFGGLMQAGSVAIGMLPIPGINRLSLGELRPGIWAVPENPIMRGRPTLPAAVTPAAGRQVSTAGLSPAFGGAFS
jgi:hypothetical protein